MGKKNSKNKKSEALGMPIGTANSKLKKKLLFDLLIQCGYNSCSKCFEQISNPSNLSVEHKQQWIKNPELFWNLNNVSINHRKCGEKMDNLVEMILEDEMGNMLPTFNHEGKVYIAGEKGQKYNIRIKNNDWLNRVEVLVTVDGRDVISGNVGDAVNSNGYVINPREDMLIKGYRQNDDNVASFGFVNKEDGYADRLGAGENVGVIGVAAYIERPAFIYKYRKYNPRVIRTNSFPPYPNDPNEKPFWIGGNTNPEIIGSSTYTISDLKLSSCVRSVNVKNAIGTEYGESIESKVTSTHFTRKNSFTPNQIISVYYDTIGGLKKRGVVVEKEKSDEPNPFPLNSFISSGYAQPPPPKKGK